MGAIISGMCWATDTTVFPPHCQACSSQLALLVMAQESYACCNVTMVTDYTIVCDLCLVKVTG